MSGAADRVVGAFDQFLRAWLAPPVATRPLPTAPAEDWAAAPVGGPAQPRTLDAAARRRSAALMRVNHVGEVCAQALYAGQALATRDDALRRTLADAGREEGDHLAWTSQRLRELDARPSVLNPVWYAGSFALGWAAGRVGDRVSLGFVVETERQVEEHLAGHLDALPVEDHASRAIVAAMQEDERRHGQKARDAGAVPLPPVVAFAMRGAAKLMTSTAYWI